jgi:hypothetical protein
MAVLLKILQVSDDGGKFEMKGENWSPSHQIKIPP